MLGDFLARGPAHDYKSALNLHRQAIKIADPLSVNPHFEVRRAAKEILVDAHLAAARDIGWGNWKRKAEVVPKWIDRASAFAEEMIANDGGDSELRLRVAEGALLALAGFRPPADPSGWVDEAQKVASQILAASVSGTGKSTIGGSACRLVADAKVMLRINRLQDDAARRNDLSVDWVLGRLKQIVDRALQVETKV